MKMVCSSASTSSGSLSVKFGVRLTTKPSRFSKPVLSPAVTARRSLLRRIRRQELRKLRALLPSMRQRRVDELAVVQEAARYIDQLHATIMARLCSGALSFETVAERLHPFTMQEIQRRIAPSMAIVDENRVGARFQDETRNVLRQQGQSLAAQNEERKRIFNKIAFY